MELVDPRLLRLQPGFDRLQRIDPALAGEEVEPELLEIARQPGGQQPVPRVGRPEPERGG